MDALNTKRKVLKEAGDGIQSETVVIAKTQARVYDFLATLFNQRPNLEFVKTLRTTGVGFFNDLAKEFDLSTEVSQGLKEMADFVEEMAGQKDADVEQVLAVDWTRLFRGISPQYGPTPPYEGVYINSGKGEIEIMKSVNHCFIENGVLIEDKYGNRPDYMGLEFSFLSYLAEAEGSAWEAGNTAQARSYEAKARAFMDEHLGLWADKFITLALSYTKTRFYKGFLHLCLGIIAEENGMGQVENG